MAESTDFLLSVGKRQPSDSRGCPRSLQYDPLSSRSFDCGSLHIAKPAGESFSSVCWQDGVLYVEPSHRSDFSPPLPYNITESPYGHSIFLTHSNGVNCTKSNTKEAEIMGPCKNSHIKPSNISYSILIPNWWPCCLLHWASIYTHIFYILCYYLTFSYQKPVISVAH